MEHKNLDEQLRRFEREVRVYMVLHVVLFLAYAYMHYTA